MKLCQFVAAVSLSVLSLVFVSCSGTSEVVNGEKPEKGSSVYPGWYNAGQPFVSDTTAYRGYATALAGDSSSAARKAVTHAEEELKSGISGRLESIRKKAADELDHSSGLNTPGFIVTLRRAETNIDDVSEKENMKIDPNEKYSGYRAFAEAVVDKEELIRELDKAMARYKTAWNAMKTSQAFSSF